MKSLQKSNRTVTLLAIILLIIGILPSLVNASRPRAVTLIYFRGSGMDHAIRLEWATATELDTAGFFIERASSSGGAFFQLDSIGFIPSSATAGGLVGAEYEAVDDDGVVNGATYWYSLVEVELDGSENRSETISVVAGEPEPTATSDPGATATNVPTASATSPGSSGSTPTATAPQSSGTRSAADATATAAAPLRTVTTREVGTNESSADEALRRDRSSDIPGSSSSGSSQADPTADGYPAPDSPADALDGGNFDDPYPGNSQNPSDEPIPGYPLGIESVDTFRAPDASSDLSGYPDARQISNNLDNLPEGNSAVTEQEPLTTLILWAGFLSSFMLFLAAVIGSTYYYRRQNKK